MDPRVASKADYNNAMREKEMAAQQDCAQGYANQACEAQPLDARSALYRHIEQLHERVRCVQFILDSLPDTFWRDHRAGAAIRLLMDSEIKRG